MELICLTQAEFEHFRDVQIEPRADWPATFGCNANGEVWPFITLGLTPENQRLYLQGEITLLDKIVQNVLATRPGGGRFFLDHRGVFSDDVQIAKFVIF